MVDSTHADAYKVLAGMNRVKKDVEQADDGLNEKRNKSMKMKKEVELFPSVEIPSVVSTPKPSFDSFNRKRTADVGFVVDPLYHQTSAMFDEGGVKGLLLNNIGVYGGCRLLLDSFEVPEAYTSMSAESNKDETIDISFTKDVIQEMTTSMSKKMEISPSLKNIVRMLDEPRTTFHFPQETDFNSLIGETEKEEEHFIPNCNYYYYEEEEPFTPNYHEDYESDDYIRRCSTARRNARAGPSHWKYPKAKGPEDTPFSDDELPPSQKKNLNLK